MMKIKSKRHKTTCHYKKKEKVNKIEDYKSYLEAIQMEYKINLL